jgi:hypothetical protein
MATVGQQSVSDGTVQKTEQGEGSKACNARTFGYMPKVKAPFQSDQQSARNGGGDPKSLCVPLTIQRSFSTPRDVIAMIAVSICVERQVRTVNRREKRT